MRLMELCLLTLGLASMAYAALPPVLDAYADHNDLTTTMNSVSSEQRILILERQVAHLNSRWSQLDSLQQQFQDLRGQFDVQQHALQLLQDQLRSQYQDLDQRLGQAVASKPVISPVSSPVKPILRIFHPTDRSTARPKSLARPSNNTTVNWTTPIVTAEQASYQSALRLLKKKEYAPATKALEGFLKRYPHGKQSKEAQYFLAQLYLLQGQTDLSINLFKDLLKQYPQGTRAADAMLQLGLAYYAKGDKRTAVSTFRAVIRQYPSTNAAQSAQTRLQQLQV